jgi:hypothetical protein
MRKLTVIAGVLMLVLSLAPMASAYSGDDDAMYAVITYPEKVYNVGDEVEITVHVFEAADYAASDDVNVSIGYSGHYVDMTESQTGRWTGTFTIEEEDIMGMGQISSDEWVTVSADVYREFIVVEDAWGVIGVGTAEEEIPLIVEATVTPPSIYLKQGETKTITWRVTYSGNVVEPDSVEGYMWTDSGQDSFEPEKVSTGVYKYVYTAPTTSISQDVQIDFEAYYTPSGKSEVENEAYTSFYLNFLHVWAKEVSLTATGATFDVYVSNMTGGAVDGANLDLTYYYDDKQNDYQEKPLSGSTDANGLARVELVYSDLGTDEDTVFIEGTVTGQGKEQDVEFDLPVKTLPSDFVEEPDDEGFDVVPSKQPYYQFNSPINYGNTAYLDADPMDSAEVDWYITTWHEVVDMGTATTSAQGTFSVDFTTPAKGNEPFMLTEAHFETAVEDISGTVYLEDGDSIYLSEIDISSFMTVDSPFQAINEFRDSNLKVEVSTLKKSEPVAVSVTYPGATSDWEGLAMLSIDPDVNNFGLIPLWTYWTESEVEGMYGDILTWQSGEFQSDIFIPENLPEKDFIVVGVLMKPGDFDLMMLEDPKEFIKINYVDNIKIGKAGTSNGDDGGEGILDNLMDTEVLGIPLLYLIIIIIVLVIVGIAAGTLAARSKKPKELEKAELAPAEPVTTGPTFDAGIGPAAAPETPPAYDQMQPMPAQAEYTSPEYPAEPPVQPEYPPVAPPEAESAYPGAPPAPAPEMPPGAPPAPAPEMPPGAPPAPAPEMPPGAPPAPAPEMPPGAPPAPAPEMPPGAPPAPAPEMPPEVPPAPAPEMPPGAPPAPAPETPPAAPPPAAVPPAVAAPADVEATMTIRCQKCGTTLTIPRKRPIKVTCPSCGASGVLK